MEFDPEIHKLPPMYDEEMHIPTSRPEAPAEQGMLMQLLAVVTDKTMHGTAQGNFRIVDLRFPGKIECAATLHRSSAQHTDAEMSLAEITRVVPAEEPGQYAVWSYALDGSRDGIIGTYDRVISNPEEPMSGGDIHSAGEITVGQVHELLAIIDSTIPYRH